MEELVISPKMLGGLIERQRKLKGLSQNEARRAFRIAQSTMSQIENGTPGTRIETIFRVLAALDLELVIRSKEPFQTQDQPLNW